MSPKKKPQKDSHKGIKITIEMKCKIIEKRERGVSVADLARTYNRSTSTICTILRNKDNIKEIDASKGVTRISTKRLCILEDVERLLLIWIFFFSTNRICIPGWFIPHRRKDEDYSHSLTMYI
ncbi:hypothetical protein B7P43_G07148 [Cryptotermes secundus]|uniref:HTH psq-type domain-containing protein n=1 Tax=Cryptotermes secundus TaxID=105785 RepID=A0A2J7Q284_9NEOP|nr:hypothetical protein B7P43_G07148 [Cryptotermes secundus]